jgi:hypothetical protein
VEGIKESLVEDSLQKGKIISFPFNYGITVGLEIHKNWNNFNWKLSELLQAYLFLPKLYHSHFSTDTLTYVVWWGESMYKDN